MIYYDILFALSIYLHYQHFENEKYIANKDMQMLAFLQYQRVLNIVSTKSDAFLKLYRCCYIT